MMTIEIKINGRVIGSAFVRNLSDLADVSDYHVTATTLPVGGGTHECEFRLDGHNRKQTPWALVSAVARGIWSLAPFRGDYSTADGIRQSIDDIVRAEIPDEFILDPPDGGDVPTDEGVRRMRCEIDSLRGKLTKLPAYEAARKRDNQTIRELRIDCAALRAVVDADPARKAQFARMVEVMTEISNARAALETARITMRAIVLNAEPAA
jgi:hypothetical protein